MRKAGGHLLLEQAIEVKAGQSLTIRVGSAKANRPLRLDAVLLVPVTSGALP